jgi:hypothetical protein
VSCHVLKRVRATARHACFNTPESFICKARARASKTGDVVGSRKCHTGIITIIMMRADAEGHRELVGYLANPREFTIGYCGGFCNGDF